MDESINVIQHLNSALDCLAHINDIPENTMKEINEFFFFLFQHPNIEDVAFTYMNRIPGTIGTPYGTVICRYLYYYLTRFFLTQDPRLVTEPSQLVSPSSRLQSSIPSFMECLIVLAKNYIENPLSIHDFETFSDLFQLFFNYSGDGQGNIIHQILDPIFVSFPTLQGDVNIYFQSSTILTNLFLMFYSIPNIRVALTPYSTKFITEFLIPFFTNQLALLQNIQEDAFSSYCSLLMPILKPLYIIFVIQNDLNMHSSFFRFLLYFLQYTNEHNSLFPSFNSIPDLDPLFHIFSEIMNIIPTSIDEQSLMIILSFLSNLLDANITDNVLGNLFISLFRSCLQKFSFVTAPFMIITSPRSIPIIEALPTLLSGNPPPNMLDFYDRLVSLLFGLSRIDTTDESILLSEGEAFLQQNYNLEHQMSRKHSSKEEVGEKDLNPYQAYAAVKDNGRDPFDIFRTSNISFLILLFSFNHLHFLELVNALLIQKGMEADGSYLEMVLFLMSAIIPELHKFMTITERNQYIYQLTGGIVQLFQALQSRPVNFYINLSLGLYLRALFTHYPRIFETDVGQSIPSTQLIQYFYRYTVSVKNEQPIPIYQIFPSIKAFLLQFSSSFNYFTNEIEGIIWESFAFTPDICQYIWHQFTAMDMNSNTPYILKILQILAQSALQNVQKFISEAENDDDQEEIDDIILCEQLSFTLQLMCHPKVIEFTRQFSEENMNQFLSPIMSLITTSMECDDGTVMTNSILVSKMIQLDAPYWVPITLEFLRYFANSGYDFGDIYAYQLIFSLLYYHLEVVQDQSFSSLIQSNLLHYVFNFEFLQKLANKNDSNLPNPEFGYDLDVIRTDFINKATSIMTFISIITGFQSSIQIQIQAQTRTITSCQVFRNLAGAQNVAQLLRFLSQYNGPGRFFLRSQLLLSSFCQCLSYSDEQVITFIGKHPNLLPNIRNYLNPGHFLFFAEFNLVLLRNCFKRILTIPQFQTEENQNALHIIESYPIYEGRTSMPVLKLKLFQRPGFDEATLKHSVSDEIFLISHFPTVFQAMHGEINEFRQLYGDQQYFEEQNEFAFDDLSKYF